MNLIDKAIKTVMPEKALKRAEARKRLEILNSGYGNHGANYGKNSVKGWIYGGGSHREDIEEHVDTLRQRSRDLYCGGSTIATAAIKTLRTNSIGTGLKLKATIDEEGLGITEEEARALEMKIEREFALWAESTDCDLERIDNFFQLQQLAFMNALLSGDCFAILPTTKRKGSVYSLRVGLIEADRVSTPSGKLHDPLFCEGVEKNEEGEVVAYHVSDFHPLSSEYSGKREWKRISVTGNETGHRNILHVMNRERVGQVRGIPLLAPVIEAIKGLGRYTDAEILAAVVNGMITVFIERETADDGPPIGAIEMDGGQGNESEGEINLAPGAVVDLAPGEKANMVNPSRPNTNFDPFVMSVIKQIGAALEIPSEIMLKAFTNNYSASRAAILEFFKTVRMYRKWFVADFCQPIYEEWLSEAVARGRIHAPGFFYDPVLRKAYCRAKWNGPSAGQLDPKKEVEAAELRVQGGYTTREQETAELNGGDFFDNVKQRLREEKLMKEVRKISGNQGSGKTERATQEKEEEEEGEDDTTDRDTG